MTEAQGYMIIGALLYIAGCIAKDDRVAAIPLILAGCLFFLVSAFVK